MTDSAALALQPPDPHLAIRPARLSDLDALNRNCWPLRTPDTVYHFLKRIRQAAQDGRGLGAVITDADDVALGYGQMLLWTRCAEISDLIIAPPYRRQGRGTGLIQYLVRAAREMHTDCVEIGAALNNPGAIALYRRLGFRDSYTQMMPVDGVNEEVLYLRIKFPQRC